MKIEMVRLNGGPMNKRHRCVFTPNLSRHWLGLALTAAVMLTGMAHAQDPPVEEGPRQNRDYYDPNELRRDPGIYRGVERAHITGGGYREFKAKRYQQAYGHVEFALRYYPNNPKALLLLSDVCVKWKSPTCDADGWFERAIELNPNIAQTYSIRALHLQRTGRQKEALESYKTALQLDPNSLNAHYNLGLLYFDMGQYALSNEHAQRSYALGAPYPGLRDKLQRAGKWKELPETTATEQAGGPAVIDPTPQQKN
jgi:tetratricopeptide (TPR) repeat protein